MEKLLRRSPPCLLLCAAANAHPLSLSLTQFYAHNSLFLGFQNDLRIAKYHNGNFLLAMPTSTAFCVRPWATVAGPIPLKQRRLIPSAKVPSGLCSVNCRACPCSIRSGKPAKAWVVLKETRTGSRSAWCHTASDGGLRDSDELGTVDDDDDDVEKSEKGSSLGEMGQGSEEGLSSGSTTEEKPVSLNRKQKSSMNSTAVAAAMPGNPDLLTIPGVGPRNLRKLVEKGIEEVAQLKQLYRDKVLPGYCALS